MHFMLLLKDLVSSFQEQSDYEGFKLAAIVNFGIDTCHHANRNLVKRMHDELAEKLYIEAMPITSRK